MSMKRHSYNYWLLLLYWNRFINCWELTIQWHTTRIQHNLLKQQQLVGQPNHPSNCHSSFSLRYCSSSTLYLLSCKLLLFMHALLAGMINCLFTMRLFIQHQLQPWSFLFPFASSFFFWLLLLVLSYTAATYIPMSWVVSCWYFSALLLLPCFLLQLHSFSFILASVLVLVLPSSPPSLSSSVLFSPLISSCLQRLSHHQSWSNQSQNFTNHQQDIQQQIGRIWWENIIFCCPSSSSFLHFSLYSYLSTNLTRGEGMSDNQNRCFCVISFWSNIFWSNLLVYLVFRFIPLLFVPSPVFLVFLVFLHHLSSFWTDR